jgi:signal transduction histidine kinase
MILLLILGVTAFAGIVGTAICFDREIYTDNGAEWKETTYDNLLVNKTTRVEQIYNYNKMIADENTVVVYTDTFAYEENLRKFIEENIDESKVSIHFEGLVEVEVDYGEGHFYTEMVASESDLSFTDISDRPFEISYHYYDTKEDTYSVYFTNYGEYYSSYTYTIPKETKDGKAVEFVETGWISVQKYDLLAEHTNYRYIMKDKDGNVLLSNTDSLKNPVSYKTVDDCTIDYELAEPMTVRDDFFWESLFYSILTEYKYVIPIAAVVCSLLSIALFIFLLCSAGHRKNDNEVRANFFDKIPYDIVILAAFIGLLIIMESFYSFGEFWEFVVILSFCYFPAMAFIMTTTTRLKLGAVIYKNTLIYIVCKFIFDVIRNLRVLWQVVIGIAVYAFLTTLFIAAGGGDEVTFVSMTLINTVVAVIALLAALHQDKLKKAINNMSNGDYDFQLDTNKMLEPYKTMGNDVNNIGNGISKALSEKLKSERMKTELITNVSHDIKTPLTSIINYVDLLSKEEQYTDNQNVRQYLEVLERQTLRLKKLTVDLVEASKASTGNITVNLDKTDLNELLSQAVAEYADRMAKKGLEAVINCAQENVYVLSDGKLLWRVIDNLFANISNYSMENTRVYIDVRSIGDSVRVVFKNISRDALNITGDELMERFVRGDSSRSTEGSGLGLSIARSFVELQNGNMSIDIEGDMFKVTIELPEVKNRLI